MDKKKSHILKAMVLVSLVLFGLRFGSNILAKGPIFDEQYILVPIQNLMDSGWSVNTAIDFEETKGPAMIWPYAAFGKLLGGSLQDLRLVSIFASIFSCLILLAIASQSEIRKNSLFLVAIGWLLIPYNIVFSQIVMGEASYLLLAFFVVYAYFWSTKTEHSFGAWLGPMLYLIALAIAMHSRIHIVAVAGAICIVAYMHEGKSSWPWWLATLLAGALRIPLWIRWGGLVSPDYQSLHGLGFRLEGVAYLAAALFPFVGIFILDKLRDAKNIFWMCIAFSLGFALVMISQPDLTIPSTIDYASPNERFQGIIATAVQLISSDTLIQQLALALFAGLGLAGLSSLIYSTRKSSRISTIAAWSLLLGWGLYAFTRGFVFDRFILTWAFLLPFVYVNTLAKRYLFIQYAALALIAIRLTMLWLF